MSGDMAYCRQTALLEASMAAKVTDDGQVTIPRWVQDQVGGPGSEVAFRRAADGTIVLEKAEAAAPLDPDRFAKLRGIAGPGPSTDEIMAMTRGE
jgi:bifunctional DNA-binding transcriptional regulator/antitoxin component of YhaV-PrlF toxin-antitoxin module